MNNLITVFTPTYDRAYILETLYQSLCRQTNKEFEWLIVDDGSTDNTSQLVESFQKKDNGFEIRYFKKENGGQHRALNFAIEKANGFLIFIADSDDYVSDDAVETLYRWCSTVKPGEKIGGVSGPRKNLQGNIIGDVPNFEGEYIDASEFERDKYHLRGDKIEAFYTDVLKKYYPIESFDGENSAEKAILWQRVAMGGYKVRWFKDVIYYSEYLPDGMSGKKLKTWLNNFNGYTVYMRQYYHGEASLIRKIRRLSTYMIVAKQKGLTGKEIRERIDASMLDYVCASVLMNLYHKGIARSRYQWMLSLDNGDSYNTVKKKNV